MRVLRVSHSATAAAWRGRERGLRDLGMSVVLYTARRWHAGGAEVELAEGEERDTVPVRTWGRHPALFLYDPRPLWRALGERWDVIDLHEEPFALATAEVLAMRVLRRNRAPVVLYTAQNLRKRYLVPFRWLERAALRAAAGVSACNRDAAAIAEAKGFAGRARVIPLGVDLAEFAPAADPRTPDPQHVVVGFVGRLVPEKGVQVLLEALSAHPELHARIAGSGPSAGDLRAFARARGIADRVEFTGPVDPARMPEFYRSVDVVAVPSLATPSWTEQFGRVAVEAMACGVPVVSSDAGALPEVVGGAGVVVAEGDAAALGAALVAAAGSERERLRAAGLTRAAECSWPAVAAEYADLYRTVRHEPEPDAAEPGLEVVVVAYGRPDLLRAALTPVASLPVTVVDNSSLPEIAALCMELGVRYLDAEGNRGFGAGVNLALADRLMPGADVLLLNPDATIEPSQVAVLHRALRADSTLASVGPQQTDAAGTPARVEWPFPSPARVWAEALGLGRLLPGGRDDRFVIGSVLLLRAEALAQAGGFDERFFLYAEETDWAYRAHLLGWRHRAVPEARAVHLGAATSADSRLREARFHAAQERYHRKHFGAAGWQLARIGAWLGAAVRGTVLRGERSRVAWRRAALYARGPVRAEARLSAASAARDTPTTDLVIMSLEPWDGVWRRNQHLVSRLLAADPALRVLFVAPAADPLHDLRSGAAPRWSERPHRVPGVDRLWTMRPVKPLPRRIDPRADRRLAQQVERAARRLGMTAPLLWVNDPGADVLARRTGWPTLYDITDDWLAADRPAAELARSGAAERWLLENADEVVVCSPELLRRKSGQRGDQRHPLHLIPNAVDLDAYRVPAPRPADLTVGPTAVYVGTLHRDRLDVDLCVATAAAGVTLVLVGPNALGETDTARLRTAGVVLLGARPRDEVAAYLQHADVLVVPHVVTAFTDSLDPIKLYEYRAAGRPVVSTPVAGFRDAAGPGIRIVTAPEFPAAVVAALDGAPADAGPAEVPTWGERAADFGIVLERLRHPAASAGAVG